MAVILNGNDQGFSGTFPSLDFRNTSGGLAIYAEYQTSASPLRQYIFAHGIVGHSLEYRLTFFYEQFAPEGSHMELLGHWSNTNSGDRFLKVDNTNDGQWHRVLYYTKSGEDPAGDMFLYHDGALVAQGLKSGTNTVNNNDLTGIGFNPNLTNSWFQGQLANIAVWNREFTPTEATQLTAGTITPGSLSTGMRAWWPLDYNARDRGPSGLELTTHGAPTFTEEEPPPGQETGVFRGDGTPLIPYRKWGGSLIPLLYAEGAPPASPQTVRIYEASIEQSAPTPQTVRVYEASIEQGA